MPMLPLEWEVSDPQFTVFLTYALPTMPLVIAMLLGKLPTPIVMAEGRQSETNGIIVTLKRPAQLRPFRIGTLVMLLASITRCGLPAESW